MSKRIAVLLIVLAIVGVSSYVYLQNMPSPQRQPKSPSPNLPTEDRLTKSDQKAVEENINGFNIEDDLRITQGAQEAGESRMLSLSQQQQAQLVKDTGSPKQNAVVVQEYNTTLPETIRNKVQYHKYQISFDYFLITAENGAEIRESPASNAAVVCRVNYLDKISLLQKVEAEEIQGSKIWYKVACSHNNQTEVGYLHSTTGVPRAFRFAKMQEAVNKLNQELAKGELHFISNYKNQNGPPPRKDDAAVDEHGYRFYHSAPAYVRADTGSDFRYIPDGMLVRILNEVGDFYYVNVPSFGGDFYIPKQYIDKAAVLSRLNQVVVVDRNQQNQAAFETRENGLDLISYTLSTTGLAGDGSFETPLGSYKVINKVDRFEYLQKNTSDVAGYAPFAIRFTGGAYIHGVPVEYEEKNGEKVDPGTKEYLHTIGTFPRSHMCVRNFTSHAEFLYNWMDGQNGAVIVIE